MSFTDAFVDAMVSLIQWKHRLECEKGNAWWICELVPDVPDPPMMLTIAMNERGHAYLSVQLTLYRPDFQGCIRDPTFSLLRTMSPEDPGAIRRGLLRYCPSHERDLQQFTSLVRTHGLLKNNHIYEQLRNHPLFYG